MDKPIAWYYAGSDVEPNSVALDADLDDAQKANCIPLYTAPPQRGFIGLTDEEYTTIMQQADHDAAKTGSVFQNLRYAIEAKLKEKNT